MKVFVGRSFLYRPLIWIFYCIKIERHKDRIEGRTLRLVYNDPANLSNDECQKKINQNGITPDRKATVSVLFKNLVILEINVYYIEKRQTQRGS